MAINKTYPMDNVYARIKRIPKKKEKKEWWVSPLIGFLGVIFSAPLLWFFVIFMVAVGCFDIAFSAIDILMGWD